jgi:large subunit ribosomal protein L30
MIIIIRISGLVEIPKEVKETLFRTRLRKKYTAILLQDNPENKKLLNHIRNFVAYGQINQETLIELVKKRAKTLGKKKIDAEQISKELSNKSPEELGIKPVFHLHPPRGGINTKAHFPLKKGVLGDNKEKINDLVRRML